MDDIKSYCEAESLRIQKKFGALEDVRQDIVGRVTSTAKGGCQIGLYILLTN
jgi:hypothetical protein